MSKFCSKCGNQLPDDGGSCPNCSPQGKPLTEMTLGEIGRTVGEMGRSINLNAQEESVATIKLGGTKIAIATILKAIAIALCVLFFLPMFSVSCQGMQITFSGWSSAFGKTVSIMGSKEKINGNFIAIFLLIIPAALFAVIQFKEKISFVVGKLFLSTAVLSAVGLISFIIYTTSVNKMAEENMLQAKFTFWYYLSIILYIVSEIISVGCMLSLRNKIPNNNGTTPPNDV